MFSLHLPKLTAAVTEHVPLENHKRAGCQVCGALWTEACQGLVSVKGHCERCLSQQGSAPGWPRALDSPRLRSQPGGLSQALPMDPDGELLGFKVKPALCKDYPLAIRRAHLLLMEQFKWNKPSQLMAC